MQMGDRKEGGKVGKKEEKWRDGRMDGWMNRRIKERMKSY